MSRTPNLSRTTTTTTLSDSSLSRRSSGSFSRASASAASVSSVSSTSFTTLFARDEEEDQEIGDDTLSEESLDSESEGSLESFTEGSLENPIRGSSQESLPCSSQGSLPSSSQDSLDGPISPTVSKTMIRAAIDKVAAKRLTERGVPRACYTPKWISNKTERNTQDIDGRMALWGSPCKPKTKDWMKFQRDEYLREQRKYEKSEDALMDLFFEPWKPKVVQHRFNFGCFLNLRSPPPKRVKTVPYQPWYGGTKYQARGPQGPGPGH
ncbi:hypothetical protein Fcan01_18390 [Folsomia candida]|uniref:Uncharacterized protein n=1 Tax=Folsomia candida TaxID=158441 RepID=A0A226DQ27_FOLCA|nr:hypothetical protein Fcan01_18390 [Folsomia candida]